MKNDDCKVAKEKAGKWDEIIWCRNFIGFILLGIFLIWGLVPAIIGGNRAFYSGIGGEPESGDVVLVTDGVYKGLVGVVFKDMGKYGCRVVFIHMRKFDGRYEVHKDNEQTVHTSNLKVIHKSE